MDKKKMNGKELTNKELEMVNGGYRDLSDVPKIEKSKDCEYKQMHICTAPDKGQRDECTGCYKNADSALGN